MLTRSRFTLTRRHFGLGVVNLGLIAAPALITGRARAEAAADIDIAIIGAGAAGLVAAKRAREKGLTARIFEARGRVGGRIFTDESLGPAFDAGAFYIHFAERNPWRDIAEALKVETIDDNILSGGFNVFRNGVPIPMEERMRRRGAFGRLSEAVERELPGQDLSFAEAARRHAPELVEAAQGMTLLSLGEDAEHVSVRDYQMLDSGDDLVMPGGYGHLLERYSAGLDIALATPVSAVDARGTGIALSTARGTVKARAVVVTVPLGVLKAGGIRFLPEMPAATLTALDGVRMGALTKVALKVEGNRFGLSPWTQYFDQGDAADPGDLVNFEFWPFERDLVVAFFGGAFARSLAHAGEAAAVSAMTARLVAILGKDAEKSIKGGRLAGWSEDPFSLGGYSIATPGHASARKVLEDPFNGFVYLAGEANAGIASMTAGGAAIAGQRAVDEIVHRLAG
jgi:monoamine oxidase